MRDKKMRTMITLMLTTIIFINNLLTALPVQAKDEAPKKNARISYTYVTESDVVYRLNQLINAFPDGSKWTNTFNGKATCYGFGVMIIYRLFGNNEPINSDFRNWGYDGKKYMRGMKNLGATQKYNYSASDVKKLLLQGKPGDVIQYNSYNSKHQHTMIIWSVRDDGVVVYHSNGDANKTTRKEFKSWDALARMQYNNSNPNNGKRRGEMILLRSTNYIVNSSSGPSASVYTVTLNPNGGYCSSSSIYVTYNSTYGSLPTPNRTNYTFDGWYTSAYGGSRVTSNTVYKYTSNTTLYAHWSMAPSTLSVSGFSGPSAIIRGSYGLRGIYASNYTLTNVSAYLLKDGVYYNNSNFIYNCSPNRNTYNIRYDGLNDKFTFKKLPKGSYTYVVIVTDSSGQCIIKTTNFTKK